MIGPHPVNSVYPVKNFIQSSYALRHKADELQLKSFL